MRTQPLAINNDFYDQLGERWYTAEDDPVALLRAESRARLPWILEVLAPFGSGARILDLASGAGFLSNPLAEAGYSVTGIDLSEESLEIARRYDRTRSVRYMRMDALHPRFENASFDVVCAMDFLEHIAEPAFLIREVSRILRPGGIFFFHTFNRNWLSHLIVIRGVEWFVRNTPKAMHVPELFLKPREVRGFCEEAGLRVKAIRGVRPRVFHRGFLKLLFTGRVGSDFEFVFTRSLLTGYCGFARNEPPAEAMASPMLLKP